MLCFSWNTLYWAARISRNFQVSKSALYDCDILGRLICKGLCKSLFIFVIVEGVWPHRGFTIIPNLIVENAEKDKANGEITASLSVVTNASSKTSFTIRSKQWITASWLAHNTDLWKVFNSAFAFRSCLRRRREILITSSYWKETQLKEMQPFQLVPLLKFKTLNDVSQLRSKTFFCTHLKGQVMRTISSQLTSHF